jgi:hypothetical protein
MIDFAVFGAGQEGARPFAFALEHDAVGTIRSRMASATVGSAIVKPYGHRIWAVIRVDLRR